MRYAPFTNAAGLTFTVVLLGQGEKGPIGKARSAPIVQFFDTRYVEGFTEHGQFVSSYYVDDISGSAGLNLDGGVPDWRIDADTMNTIRAWLALEEDPASPNE